MKTLGLYIHIPFCKRKCDYCDFVSFPNMEEMFDQYIDALIHEARLYTDYLSDHVIDTVFIGGGTPSLLSPKQMESLLYGLKAQVNWQGKEVTIEANPETLDEEKAAAYASVGINRISMGLQTHDNDILKNIGRRHTYETFIKAYEIADKYIGNINVDTMFGLPDQTLQSFQTTIQRLIDLSPSHISSYALKLEEGTKLAARFSGIDDDVDRTMYHALIEMLSKAGYMQYETSNFAKKGGECLHNMKYWTGGEYLGLGVAAHSYISEDLKKRFSNTDSFEQYLNDIGKGVKPIAHTEQISEEDEKAEFLMLRLRLADGIYFSDYQIRYNEDFQEIFADSIKATCEAGLITVNSKGIRPTIKGFDLQNTLIFHFMKKL